MENTGGKLTMENTGEKLIPDDSKKVVTTYIPPELLLKIFGYIARNELIAAQCVCQTWRSVAHDKSFWKDYTFVVSGTPEDERRLTVMPALRNIAGYADNSFINIILDHVADINKMNCKYKPPISSMQVQSLVQKYPELQSITLDICAPDILQSVEALQTSEKITELILHKKIPCISTASPCDCSSLSELTNILNIFADPRNFRNLSNLDVDGLIHAGAFQNPLFLRVFTRVLTNRSHKLQSVKLGLNYTVDVDVINALNMCSSIQNLHLLFHKKYPTIVDISRMHQLRLLVVRMSTKDDDSLNALYDALSRNTWLYLTEVEICVHSVSQCKTDILGVLMKNARQLRILHYCVSRDKINECQLEHIGNFPRLERLFLSFFPNISKKGMTYISHCYNLKYLYLSAYSTNITDLNPCIADMIHSLKELESLRFTVGNLTCIRLNDKEEIKIFTSCHVNNN